MTVFVLADNHFGHKNIIDYCDRGFDSTMEMDRWMISAWNSRVSDSDLVYYLGDLSFGNQEYITSILSKLNGTIFLIPGNHDSRVKKVLRQSDKHKVLGKRVLLRINDDLVTLSHRPLETWAGKESLCGVLLHGHTHGNLEKSTGRLDVGVDSIGYAPLDLESAVMLAY